MMRAEEEIRKLKADLDGQLDRNDRLHDMLYSRISRTIWGIVAVTICAFAILQLQTCLDSEGVDAANCARAGGGQFVRHTAEGALCRRDNTYYVAQ